MKKINSIYFVLLILIIFISGCSFFNIDLEKLDNKPQTDFQCKNEKYSTVKNSYHRDLITLTDESKNKLFNEFKSKGNIALNDLSDLNCLEYLDISPGYKITDLSFSSSLTNLEELIFMGSEINDLSPLKKLRNLRKLKITSKNFFDISPLKDLISLTEVSVTTKDITPLNSLTNLESVSLGYSEINDLSPLLNLKKLKRLNLYLAEVSDISALYEMQNLEYIYIVAMRINGVRINEDQCNELKNKLPNSQIECIRS